MKETLMSNNVVKILHIEYQPRSKDSWLSHSCLSYFNHYVSICGVMGMVQKLTLTTVFLLQEKLKTSLRGSCWPFAVAHMKGRGSSKCISSPLGEQWSI